VSDDVDDDRTTIDDSMDAELEAKGDTIVGDDVVSEDDGSVTNDVTPDFDDVAPKVADVSISTSRSSSICCGVFVGRVHLSVEDVRLLGCTRPNAFSLGIQ
jgi:hypothetical protein